MFKNFFLLLVETAYEVCYNTPIATSPNDRISTACVFVAVDLLHNRRYIMKKQLFRRIMALVLAFSMVMSLACTTTFAIGDVDDGVETLEVTPVDDETPAEEDDVTVPEEEESASEPEETPAEEEAVQPQPEPDTEPESAGPEQSAPAEEEGLVGETSEDTGWREITNQDGTISYQYWYQDAQGNLVQAKDYWNTDSDMANANAYNAYYIKDSFTVFDKDEEGNIIVDEKGNEKVLADVGAGYYYFDAQGNCTYKNTWTLYSITVIGKDGVVTSDDNYSGYKCLKMTAKVENTGVYYGQKVTAKKAITAPSGKVYLTNKSTSGVYTAKTLTSSTFMWHVKETLEEYKDRNGVSWQFIPKQNTDEVGVYGILLTDYIYYGNIHSEYKDAPDSKYCYKFVDGRPAGNLDGKLDTYYNSSNKTYYAVYFADSKTCGVSVGYYAKQGKKCTNFGGKSSKYYAVSSKGVASLYAGIYQLYYYKKGVVQTSYTGWVKVQNTSYSDTKKADVQTMSTKYRGVTKSKYAVDWYYVKKGKCLTGKKKKAPAIDSSDSRSYYYYFNEDNGKLIQNLFTYNTAFKASKMQIICDDKAKNHNTTFLLYNSSTKKYDIAALQVICSTPKNPNGTSGIKHGTYYLSSLSRRSWLQNKSKTMWFSYLTYINTTSNKRTGFFFHSPAYSKQSYHALNKAYNAFGRSNTGGCLRLQTGYCQLVSSISTTQQKHKQYKYVVVKFGNYSNVSPFKRITQAMIQIDLKKFNYDPTTPKSKL